MFFRLTLLILFTAGLIGPPQALSAAEPSAINLPDIGDAAANLLTLEQEQQIGKEFMRSARMSLNLLEDPAIETYLQGLGERLVSQVEGFDQPITLFVVNDPAINAFAGPGGYIGVHTGLILAADTEGELASVLAHELAHVVQRHLLRSVEAGQRVELTTLAAMIAAILLGSQDPQAGQAVLASTMAGSTQRQLNYSRRYEQEADRVGLDMMAKAGFDPRDMVRFFEVLQYANRYADLRAMELLQTHPLTLSRIADARNRAEQMSAVGAGDNLTFQLIKARTRVLSGDSIPIQRQSTTEATPPAAKRYAQALEWLAQGDADQAREAIHGLLKTDTHRVLYHLTAAQVELKAGRQQAAQKVLTTALALFPNNQPLTELLAETWLQTGDAARASALLETQIRSHPNRRLYALYARAAEADGQLAKAYQALAESHYLDGDTRQAIAHLRQALEQTPLTPYERLAMEARLKAWMDEVQAQGSTTTQPAPWQAAVPSPRKTP